jgi:beta-glucanase (GH16 family)
MLGDNFSTVSWPACGEIDIMEHRGSELNKITGAFHYPGFYGGSAKVNTTTIANATTEFHVYKLEWTEAVMNIFVDDKLFHSLPNNANIPYNQNFFFLLNIAMGGGFGGAVDPSFSSAIFEIDYVRVYK